MGSLTEKRAKKSAEQLRVDGYAIMRSIIDPGEISRLQAQTRTIYEAGLKHHATYRDGNLCFEILPERYCGKRYVIQAYRFGWISPYTEWIHWHIHIDEVTKLGAAGAGRSSRPQYPRRERRPSR